MIDLESDPLNLQPEGPSNSEQRSTLEGLLDALAAVRRHWLVCILVTVAITGVGAWGVQKKFQPKFQAEAKLHVAGLAPRVVFTDPEWHKESIVGFYDDFVRTLAQQIKSETVLQDAVDALEEDGVDWVPADVEKEETIPHLRARLEVNRVRDTHLLSISLEDTDRELPAAVINAITDAFLTHRKKTAEDDQRKLTSDLKTEKATIEGELKETYRLLDELSPRLGSAVLDERQNIFYERIQVLEQGLTKVFVSRVEAEGALKSATVIAARLREPVPAGQVEAELDLDSRVRDVRVMVSRRAREIDDQLLGLGAEHPHRKPLENRRAEMIREINETETETRERILKRMEAQRLDDAEAMLARAQADLDSVKESEASMKKVLLEAKTDLVDYGRAMFEGSQLRAQATRLLQTINDVESRITNVKIEGLAPSRVKIHERAVRPGKPAKDKRMVLTALFATIALVIGFGAAWGVDFLNRLRKDRETA